MSLSITDLVLRTRASARNAMDPRIYPDYRVHLALMDAMQEWSRETEQCRQLTTITLSTGSATVPNLPAGMRPEFIIQTTLTLAGKLITPTFSVTSRDNVLWHQLGHTQPSLTTPTTPATGRPSEMAFTDATTAVLDTIPDQAYTLEIWWYAPPPLWTPGQAFISATAAYGLVATVDFSTPPNSPGSIYAIPPTVAFKDAINPATTGTVLSNVTVSGGAITGGSLYGFGTGYTSPVAYVNGILASPPVFGLPDDALSTIATNGAPYYLQMGEPANASIAQARHNQFLADAKRFKLRNAGGRGARVVSLANPHPTDYGDDNREGF